MGIGHFELIKFLYSAGSWLKGRDIEISFNTRLQFRLFGYINDGLLIKPRRVLFTKVLPVKFPEII